MPETPAPDPLMKAGEVAAEFGVDADTVARWANDGLIPHFKTPGGHRRFRRSDVDALKSIEPTEAASA